MERLKTFSCTVSGRVQHVGFRYFVLQEAMNLNLEGFVKNLESGDVKAEVQGPPEKLDIFIEKLREGPSWARVDDIKLQELPAGTYRGFEIR